MTEAHTAASAITGLIGSWLRYQTYYRQVPSVAIGVALDGDIIYRDAFGFADREYQVLALPSTRYRIASHSKVFTATALMKLADEARLNLDDKVSSILDWFQSDADPNLERITVRQLLTHSSGLTRDGQTGHWGNDRFPNLEQIQCQIRQGPSIFAANEHLKYSNFAFTVAGQVIETVTGQSYEAHVTKALLEPLGMTSTTPDLPPSLADHAVGYGRWLPDQPRQVFDHVPARVMNSATGFSSTVDDLLTWYRAHTYGVEGILDDYQKREMQRTQLTHERFDWGLGFQIVDRAGMHFVGHGGGYPGFSTSSGLNQDHKLAIVVLTNCIDGPAGLLLDGIAKLLGQVLADPQRFEGHLDADVDGFYDHRWRTSLFSRVGGKLASLDPAPLDPLETLELCDHIEGKRFRSPTTHPFRSPGETFEFQDEAVIEAGVASPRIDM